MPRKNPSPINRKGRMGQADTPCRQEAGMKTAMRNAATKALIGVAGLIAVGSAIATGNWPVVMIAAAVISGAGLLAAFADMWAVEARSEAARIRNQTSAGIEPGRDVQPQVHQELAELEAYYARLRTASEIASGRFQELVSS